MDSNLDWGQDFKRLVLALQKQGISEARVYYFGGLDIEYYEKRYGVRLLPLNAPSSSPYLAISAQYLFEPYRNEPYRWLIPRPSQLIGTSIYLYVRALTIVEVAH